MSWLLGNVFTDLTQRDFLTTTYQDFIREVLSFFYRNVVEPPKTRLKASMTVQFALVCTNIVRIPESRCASCRLSGDAPLDPRSGSASKAGTIPNSKQSWNRCFHVL